MARKTNKRNIKDFTKNIHSTRRSGTRWSAMKNWDEKEARLKNRLSCKSCRYFYFGCSDYIGKWHMPCEEFKWD